MAEVSNIVNAIKTRTQAVLGITYSEMAYAIEHEKNTYKGNVKRFSVLANNFNQDDVAGVLGNVTYNQNFKIKLSDSYASIPGGDSNKAVSGNNLIEKTQAIFKDLVNTKCGVPNIVITVSELSVDDLEYIEASNVILAEMIFNIKYRVQL